MAISKLKHSPLHKAITSTLATALGLSSLNMAVQAAEEGENAEEEGDKIIVVGSRIRRDGIDNAEPIEIISAADAKLQGIDSVGALLRASTLASGSPQVTAASSTAFVQNGGTGTETLSLRGLGANRTLVLLNGRRAGPSGTRGGVSAFDLNAIPLSAVERIEILKDGASSLYGSDAVAGVVNIITKSEDGSAVDMFISQPEESGGEQFRLSGTWGKTYDRGNFLISADYSKEDQLAQGDRDFFACGERYLFDQQTGERGDVIDPRTGRYHCTDLLWGHVWLYDYQGAGGNVPGSLAQFDYDGDLGNYIPGYAVDPTDPDFLVTPPGWFPVGYDRASDALANADHPFQDLTSLIPETEKTTIYAQGEYEINDSTSAYAELLLNRRKTTTDGYRQFWGYIYNENFFGGNPLSAGWTGAQWFSPTPITDEGSDSEITVDYTRFVAGLTGDIGNTDWYYDVSMQLSRSDGDYQTDFIYNDRIVEQNWLTGSCVGITHSVSGGPCMDIPWLDPQFLAGNISPDMRAYLFGTEIGNTVYEQQALEAVISGTAMDMDAGPLDVAIGFHYRTDEIEDVPGEQTRLGNTWGSTSAGITTGDSTTKAIFGEAIIPIINGVPGFQNVELKISSRFTDVSSFGDDTTFKFGLNWDIVEGVKVRASRGTSFRSPALFELYLADQSSFAGQRTIDPCYNWADANSTATPVQQANCAADGIPGNNAPAISATVFTGGGAGVLEAETSISETIGIVWTPEFADIAISLDYFDFLIEGEVTQLGAATIVGRCYSSEFFPNDPLCDQFDRDPTDLRITNVRDSYLNIASQINKGFDLAINYQTEFEFGTLRLESRHTYQDEDSIAVFDDFTTDTNGEFGDPQLTASLRAALTIDDWTYNWTINYLGSVSNVDRDLGSTLDYRGETYNIVNYDDATYYHAFSASTTFDDLSLVFGVANLTDEEPPQVSRGTSVSRIGNAAFYSQYDWRGRRAFVNLSYNF
ncbi:MAG: TonB-dependent receptor [Kangiellaceae bacterium]|nr:TonB-dependent receptor [Kangiellaceae bacterium]